MTKIIIQEEYYTLPGVISNLDSLFVFGDNTKRIGNGGQAQIRPASNTYGIATKNAPCMLYDSCFFDDNNQDDWKILEQDLDGLYKVFLSNEYEVLIFPKDGLGTGLSDLPNKAPNLYKFLIMYLNTTFGIKTIDCKLYLK